ncbi:Homeobox protein Hox-A9 [Thelohanellus kitauei]|uniref:Homeobox protein Hox-A9 n=1 Tax=Thelohanellus kitauei TaxID=669202 RepID=A0A0C2J825_THEKT|nr:Homeobox protein Hox-A9 [Thelohanellus kitauei]
MNDPEFKKSIFQNSRVSNYTLEKTGNFVDPNIPQTEKIFQRNYHQADEVYHINSSNSIYLNRTDNTGTIDSNIIQPYVGDHFTPIPKITHQNMRVYPHHGFSNTYNPFQICSNLYNQNPTYDIRAAGDAIDMRILLYPRSVAGHSTPPPLELRLPCPDTNYPTCKYPQIGKDDSDPLKLVQLAIQSSTEVGVNTENNITAVKRKRCIFTDEQLKVLQSEFTINHYINKDKMSKLAQDLYLTQNQIKNWFQNQRMKLKKRNVGWR